MKARLILASSLAALLAIAPAVSAAPVAEARGNEFLTKYVEVNKTVTLDGSGSYGADCDLSYSWTMVSRPAGSGAEIAAPTSVQPTFIPYLAGDYVIELVVADSSGTSSPARITVSAINGSEWPLPAKNADRWMTLTPKMMDRTLPEITLPGTHDSGAYLLDKSRRGPDFDDRGFSASWWQTVLLWLGGSDEDGIKNQVAYDVARAQEQNLLQQLEGGVRYFDLRVTIRNDVFYTYHGLLGERLETLLEQIKEFMAASEGELVAVNVSHLKVGTHKNSSRVFNPVEHQLLMQMLVNELKPYLYPRNGRSTADLLAIPFGRITADGAKIILSYDGLPPATVDPNSQWFWPYELWTSPGGYTDTEQMFDAELVPCPREGKTAKGGQFPDQQCSATRYSAGSIAKGFVLHQTLTAGEGVGTNAAKCRASQHIPDWALALYKLIEGEELQSFCGKTRTLRQLSNIVNPYLPEMLAAILPVRPGLIRVDFYEESAVVSEAIRLNQRDTRAPTSQATRHPPANRYGGSFGDVTVTMTASEETGGSGIGGMRVVTEGAQQSSGDYCGARKEVIIKAKGATTVKYRPWDREGNTPDWQSLVVRTDLKCDFNRDGKTDAADRPGLLNSVRDRSIMFLGDLDEDGRYTSQEWMRCWYHLYYGRPL